MITLIILITGECKSWLKSQRSCPISCWWKNIKRNWSTLCIFELHAG